MSVAASTGSLPDRRIVSWVDGEGTKADPRYHLVILENPGAVREIDALLVETYEPYIRGELGRTGYFCDLPAGERWIDSK